ncbi:MAG: helix-turn-helix domain-containing protein [Desulfobaccales bacterium]
MQKEPIASRLLSNDEAAHILGISPYSLRGKVARREIKFIKLGRRVLFREEDLMELIEKCTVQPRSRREAE